MKPARLGRIDPIGYGTVKSSETSRLMGSIRHLDGSRSKCGLRAVHRTRLERINESFQPIDNQ